MPAQTFDEVRSHPVWNYLSIPEKEQWRQDWVKNRLYSMRQEQNPDARRMLQQEAYSDEPERLRMLQPTFWDRNPKMSAGVETAKGVGEKVLEGPQQLLANVINDYIVAPVKGERSYPPTLRGAGEALAAPFKKTADWMNDPGLVKEKTELPGGWVSQQLTDPMNWAPAAAVGEVWKERAAIREAANALKKGLFPKSGMIPIPGSKEAMEVGVKAIPAATKEIPNSWATMTPEQRAVYKRMMDAGRRHLPEEELKGVAETVANLHPLEAEAAAEALGQEGAGGLARKTSQWSRRAPWERGNGPWREQAPTPPPKTGRGEAPMTPSATVGGTTAPTPRVVTPATPVQQVSAADLNSPGAVADALDALSNADPEIPSPVKRPAPRRRK